MNYDNIMKTILDHHPKIIDGEEYCETDGSP